MHRLDPLRLLDRWLPERFNPLARSGAVASTSFIVAAITGVALLIWYVPSVTQAHESLTDMGGLALFTRTLHRVSSDACMLFVLIHTLRLFAAGRFGGARWLGWVTGVLLMSLLWAVGWSGYWLLWDARAHLVAVGTAKLVDVVPVFTDPLSRSFLTDDGVNSLLFFVVFFFHMLVPMAMCVIIWLHIARLARPDWLTKGGFGAAVVGSMVALSLVMPADLDAPARMATLPSAVAIDAWYLLPLVATERLGGGAIWAIFLISGLVLFSLPWTLKGRRPPPAAVDVGRCNACQKCFNDCPHEAISMAPRTDGKSYDVQASVEPLRCVGCGVCAGSCDTAGIGLDWITALSVRKTLDDRLAEGAPTKVAFVCSETLPGAEIPGWTVERVPCVGWVHALTVERAIRHGATEVVLGACPSCVYREGARWAGQRMAGERAPALRDEKRGEVEVRVVAVSKPGDLDAAGRRRPWVAAALGAALLTVCALGSIVPLTFARSPDPTLVVSFEHPGAAGEDCRARTEEELAALPPHMRTPEVCERGRASVTLRVWVDGEAVHEATYDPSGIWGDGPSIGVETFPVSSGAREVRVALDDGRERFAETRLVTFVAEERAVVVFDRTQGFRWP